MSFRTSDISNATSSPLCRRSGSPSPAGSSIRRSLGPRGQRSLRLHPGGCLQHPGPSSDPVPATFPYRRWRLRSPAGNDVCPTPSAIACGLPSSAPKRSPLTERIRPATREAVAGAHQRGTPSSRSPRQSSPCHALTLRLRELGGLIRTAGDPATISGSEYLEASHVKEALLRARRSKSRSGKRMVPIRAGYVRT